MSVTAMIPAGLAKEVRALAPLWLGCGVIVWAGGIGDQFLFRAGFLTYVLGSAALGALSIGHEYSSRTLSLLLTAPVSRRRVFAIKASVLVTMLLSLAVIALVRLPVTPVGRDLKDTALVGTLALLSSVFLAPWLTMLCRNVIAGTVFSLSIPAALLVGSELLTLAVTGHVDPQPSQFFRMQVLWISMLLLPVIGGTSSWRTFMRLEAIEGPQSDFRLPRLVTRSGRSASAAARFHRTHPVWCLLRKEVHLQQLTFVTSALYVCGWIATLAGRRLTGIRDVEDALFILTVVHGGIIALLSGSLASAEERHLGVLDSGLLMPLSTALQWTIKVVVVFGLCVCLAMVLPVALVLGFGVASSVDLNIPFVLSVLLLAAVSLYVSSLSTSGVKALLISGPVALSLAVLIPLLVDVVLWVGRLFGFRRHDPFGPGAMLLVAATVFLLLVGFGLANHRSSDRSPLRIWRQVLWLSGSITCIMLVALFASAV